MVKKFTKKRGSIQGKTGFPRMLPLFTLHKGGQAIMQMIPCKCAVSWSHAHAHKADHFSDDLYGINDNRVHSVVFRLETVVAVLLKKAFDSCAVL